MEKDYPPASVSRRGGYGPVIFPIDDFHFALRLSNHGFLFFLFLERHHLPVECLVFLCLLFLRYDLRRLLNVDSAFDG
ncbi:hypothetical protein L596_010517 [Steinernema carpocapsae]|uniref:Uncharacterized protein n=1 Tax=Steinernema carpocapsae TaxID=34508 RepID=A0A4U5PJA7_STECR|nr:hypothetical protein L596_010517 [Steinernema carpocapsae]